MTLQQGAQLVHTRSENRRSDGWLVDSVSSSRRAADGYKCLTKCITERQVLKVTSRVSLPPGRVSRAIPNYVDGQAGLTKKVGEPTDLLAMEISGDAGRLADAISEQNRISALNCLRDRGSCREP